jgi:hypothetical protein
MAKKEKKDKKNSDKAQDMRGQIKVLDKLMSVKNQLKKVRRIVDAEITKLDAGTKTTKEQDELLIYLIKKLKKDLKKFRDNYENPDPDGFDPDEEDDRNDHGDTQDAEKAAEEEGTQDNPNGRDE